MALLQQQGMGGLSAAGGSQAPLYANPYNQQAQAAAQVQSALSQYAGYEAASQAAAAWGSGDGMLLRRGRVEHVLIFFFLSFFLLLF